MIYINISIFDVSGPIMIGPSSSHTAGAACLARTAAIIAKKPFNRVCFDLHGSFLKTGAGHGTHEALLAGALGLMEDDERIVMAFELAKKAGVTAQFGEVELADSHENSVRITFFHTDGTKSVIEGSSIGGGRILITKIDGLPVEISAECPTVLIRQNDIPGVVSDISSLLAKNNINIAVMRVSRESKGDIASTVIETDTHIPQNLAADLSALKNILAVRIIDTRRESPDV